MKFLSDDALLTAYIKAVQYQLDQVFISMLYREINIRNLQIPAEEKIAN